MRNVIGIARETIDALNIEAEKLNTLDTLVHDHGDSGPISLEQLL